jgi:hypothetical protein
MEAVIKIVGLVVVSFVGILILSFVLSWPVMMLWNGCLVDAVDGVKEITWLQGWGISILSGILFKSTAGSK